MLITSLKRREEPSGDVVDLLLECHARIRHFSSLGVSLAHAVAAPPNEIADATKQIRRYFEVALPLHVEDEEQSIAPRLRGIDPALDDALAAMCDEHAACEEPLDELLVLCGHLNVAPSELGTLQRRLAAAAQHLVELFETHFGAEEALIFPALRQHLGAAARACVADEIHLRRRPRS